MTSVMGLLEERETAARVRTEELLAEAERVLAELAVAEGVLERRVIARAELAEALAAPDEAVDARRQAAAETAMKANTGPVAGSIVPRWRPGTPAEALAADHRQLIELVEGEPAGSEGVSAKELTGRLGLELVPAKIEGVRSRAKRLVERECLMASPSGRFMPRASSDPDAGS
ncbi:hypothetical protein GCM10022403_018880 [Streptomyces coacervatus]|uniref:Uncharacterized protein n=1 Tax=Streptomyces coacervatus TaxID=647381 RepID=A0ABP7H7J4_9ACTN|nr:hypothetical protein [Streptomyces coacervatus]MDF2267368.1 hypothetical protein [Streptomyces coacervatus]